MKRQVRGSGTLFIQSNGPKGDQRPGLPVVVPNSPAPENRTDLFEIPPNLLTHSGPIGYVPTIGVRNPFSVSETMLRTATSLITIACVFAHALLGCCIHHAHACGSDELCSNQCRVRLAQKVDSHEARESAEANHGCCDGSHGAAPLSASPGGPQESAPEPSHGCCDEESCQWTNMQTQVEVPSSCSSVATFNRCDPSSLLVTRQRDCLRRWSMALDRLSSSLRVHALDQVWQL